LLVVEAGDGSALAYCGKLLADAGARVIKIEPPQGDPSRFEGPRGRIDNPERSPVFLHLNTNKESLALDIEHEQGRGLLRRLAERADVLLESLPPGRLAELGVEWEHLREANPRLVMCSITPYGQTGPYRDRVATTLTLFASSGAMYREGLPEREPLRYAGQVPRTFSGEVAAALVASALFRRRSTDRGDWIDVSEMDCWASHPNQITRRLMHAFSGESESREDTKSTSTPAAAGFGRGTYRCADGYVTFLPLGDRHWPRLVELLEDPSLSDDPRFATREARRTHRADFEELFERFMIARPVDEVFALAQRAGIPSAPLRDAPRLLNDRQLIERGYLAEADHPVVGNLKYAGAPANAGPDFWSLRTAAPLLGQHSAGVLVGDLDLDGAAVEALTGEGVVRIGVTP
jgi:crotonobetainyl-CoA:carnitine CoA-transferase CaiB-like acyl-CoA transferase